MAPNRLDQASQVLVNGFPLLTINLLFYFFYVRFGLEGLAMRRLFKKHYTSLTIINQRSFTSHCLWLTVKICLIPAAWPFIAVFFCHKALRDPLFPQTHVSYADVLSIAFIAVIAMFLFEMIYRLKISPVTLIHHCAGCVLAAWEVVEQVMDDSLDAESQFRLLILYGAFEVVFESFPHIAVVYYRCQAKTSVGMKKTSRVRFVSGCSSTVGTVGELVAIAIFMWRNWWFWGFASKVILPILHFAFMAAQVHGARIGFQSWKEFDNRSREAAVEEAKEGDTSRDSGSTAVGQDGVVGMEEVVGEKEKDTVVTTTMFVENDASAASVAVGTTGEVELVRVERETPPGDLGDQDGEPIYRTCPDVVTRWAGVSEVPPSDPAIC